jgi:hypothetical protein
MSRPGGFPTVLRCPFCGSEETDRIDLDGRRFLVFACMFTPQVDPSLSEAQVAEELARAHPGGGTPYFRGMCDRLHLYVTVGDGGRRLTAGAAPPAGAEPPSASAGPGGDTGTPG